MLFNDSSLWRDIFQAFGLILAVSHSVNNHAFCLLPGLCGGMLKKRLLGLDLYDEGFRLHANDGRPLLSGLVIFCDSGGTVRTSCRVLLYGKPWSQNHMSS
jgi:hypothetical protein